MKTADITASSLCKIARGNDQGNNRWNNQEGSEPMTDRLGRAAPPDGVIRAVLGPTNTGKTYLAVERMLGHSSGIIGFPLRLLARENYDRIAERVGRASVALITGEEKIVPSNPRYYVCTVEAMPMDMPVDFLAVDEIQLCADPDRGHIFTDRLLYARGRYETMFLGSDTMAELIQRLVPNVTVETRARMSTLTWAGPKKLSRLKRRSALVAFSVDQVYALAEAVRQTRGGTAVVLGALSPRTRNAQVDMYQAGEVDYLVATDAIGMGLNMDVDHVAFAQLRKYDGARRRPLTPPEIGQIAGRAGRHMNDGTFGVTHNAPPPDEEVIRRVEAHEFPTVTKISWRNRALDFSSPKRLFSSLNAAPPSEDLIRARDADDQLVLGALMRDPLVVARSGTKDRVRLLWDVCQIPDFRKVMPDHHAGLVGQVFQHLVDADGAGLPDQWVAGQIERLDRTDGDIDTLTARIAHIRTWTYITHRGDWLSNCAEWQVRARRIEDALSDVLHQRLTDRFVDRRATVLGRGREGLDTDQGSEVTAKGDVLIGGHLVGRMEGLRFTPSQAADRREAKALSAAAHRVLERDAQSRVKTLENSPDQSFGMSPEGLITWQGRAVARLGKGDSITAPRCVLTAHSMIDSALVERARLRIQAFVDRFFNRRLKPILDPPVGADILSGAARGLLFQLRENLGAIPRRDATIRVKDLDQSARAGLSAAGLRAGVDWLYLAGMADPKAIRARAFLWAAWNEADIPLIPNTAMVCLPADTVPREAWPSLGFAPCGPIALRLDRWEKMRAAFRRHPKDKPITANADLLEQFGLTGAPPATVHGVLRVFGYKPLDGKDSSGCQHYGLVSRNRGAKRSGKMASQKAPGQPRFAKASGGKGKSARRPDPNSPFAVLKDLVVKS